MYNGNIRYFGNIKRVGQVVYFVKEYPVCSRIIFSTAHRMILLNLLPINLMWFWLCIVV